MLEAYNGGVLFGNSPGAMARNIVLLGLNTETAGDMEKAQISARGEYLETAFLLSPDRRRYWELILSLKNDYAKQHRNYSRNLTDMYGLMVEFEPTRATLVDRGRNKGLNFGNVVADFKVAGNRYHGGCGGTGRKLECWHSGGEHL